MEKTDSELYLLLWGKTEQKKEQNTSKWHPLICHMLDVANVTKQLLNISVNNTKSNLLSRYYEDDSSIVIDKIAFLACLHDLGKASPPFQGLWAEYCKTLSAEGLKFPPINDTTKKHGLMTSSLIMNSIAGDEKDKTLLMIFEKIAISLGGHHGIMTEKNKWQHFAGNKFFAGSATWHDSRFELVKKLHELVIGNSSMAGLKQMIIEALPGKDKLKQLKHDDTFFMLLSGLTSISDWLGSSTEWFEFAKINNTSELTGYNDKSLLSAKKAVESIWKENRELEKDFVDGSSLFSYLFPSIDKPRPMQDKCINLYQYGINPKKTCKRIVIIEAPTGEGKTEASFYLMDNWLRNEDTKGAYIALPTQATSNQMFERFATFLSKGHGQNIGINLLHSMKDFNQTWIEINNKTLSDGKYDALVANTWFESPKRRLVTPFGVGTIDQTLMGVLQVKHMFVRLFGLSGKTIIFDEVHAYDVYMSTLLERLIQWLSALGSSVILLSATLPEYQKNKLLKAYVGDGKNTDLKPAYPAITYTDQSLTPKIVEFESNPNVRQNVTIVPVENDLESVASKILDKINHGGCAAWICNTVKKSQEIYSYLSKTVKDDTILLLFHAKFMASDRLSIEKNLLSKMGKPGTADRPQKAIIVATQVIEQSLDLDFDIIVSQLAPIDLLLQRIGRLHRHNRTSRPSGCAQPEIMVMMPNIVNDVPDFGNDKYVYDESILLRTYIVLNSKLNNGVYKFSDRDKTVKELVELVYGNSKLKASPDLLSHLSVLDKAFNKEREETELLANERIIDPPFSNNPSSSDDSHVNFSFINTIEIDDDDPDVSNKFKALTRLSDGPSIKIACIFESNGKYYLDTKSSLSFDLSRPPSTSQEIESVLLNTVSVSDRAAFFKLINKELAPKVWSEIPSLRYLPLLVFKNVNGKWQTEIDNMTMSYSSEIGFQIQKEAKP